MISQKKKLLSLSLILLLVMVLFAVLHMERINTFLSYAMYVLRPVIIGLVLAFLCNPIFRLFERKLFFNVHPHKLRRILSLIATYLILLLVILTLLMLIVPQLIKSIMEFFSKDEDFFKAAVSSVNEFIDFFNHNFSTHISHLVYEDISRSVIGFFRNLDMQSMLKNLLTYENIAGAWLAIQATILLCVDMFFGIFISIYLLYTKEKRYAQIMRLRHALFSDTMNARITRICTIADKSFGGFLRGKLLDSTIVGLLVYVIISLMGIKASSLNY